MLAWKLRIAVLWMSVAVLQSAGMILAMFEPSVLRDMLAGDWEGTGVQVWTATFWLGPMVMAYLTLVLEGGADRWTNGVVAGVTAVSGISALFGPVGGEFGGGAVFVGLVQVLVALLIVWHAWKWPQPSDVTPHQMHDSASR